MSIIIVHENCIFIVKNRRKFVSFNTETMTSSDTTSMIFSKSCDPKTIAGAPKAICPVKAVECELK